jgi:hypothetical protein
VTSSGATGRPGTDQDARNKSAPPSDRGQDQQSNGAQPGAPSGNGSPNGQRGAPDPAVDNRRQQAEAGQRGAAAARVATRNRTREDTTPRSAQDSTQNPWSRPGDQQGNGAPAQNGGGQRSAQPGPSSPNGSPAGAAHGPAVQAAQQPQQGPVPPPSLVAQQGGAAPAVFPAPPGPVPAAPLPPSTTAVDTQASLEAVPAAPRPSVPPKQTPSPSRSSSSRRPGRVRKARLRLLRIDPWSVMKTAFLLSVALGITLFVAVAVLWSVLDAAGVFSSIDDIITDMTASDANSGIDINQYIELSRVLGFTTLIAVVDVVLLTALATLGAFLYNLSASLLGGLELTLAEDD